MYARWGPERWDGKAVDEKPLFYHGTDDYTVKVLIAMEDEVQTVCRKMEALVPSLNLKDVCTLKQICLDAYDGQTSDTSTLKTCLNTNKVHTGSEHPCIQGEDKKFLRDLNHRYLAEDCPTGLCFSKGLAELCAISTPTIDKVISWAQQSLGKEWLVDGKMQGKNVSETRAPQGVGIKSSATLDARGKLRLLNGMTSTCLSPLGPRPHASVPMGSLRGNDVHHCMRQLLASRDGQSCQTL